MIDVKKSAYRFSRDCVSGEIDRDLVESIIRKQGYTIIYFRAVNNEDEVGTVLKTLNLESMAMHSRGFVYADDRYRLVFVNEDLNEEEKLIVLLHEEGHIYLEHSRNHKVIGLDVIEEHEANEFVHYVLHPDFLHSFGKKIKEHKIVCMSVIASFIIVIGCVTWYQHYKVEQTLYGEYYVTKTGEKYHLKNCGVIEGKEVRRLTQEDMESGRYEPCSFCIGNDEP